MWNVYVYHSRLSQSGLEDLQWFPVTYLDNTVGSIKNAMIYGSIIEGEGISGATFGVNNTPIYMY